MMDEIAEIRYEEQAGCKGNHIATEIYHYMYMYELNFLPGTNNL